MTINALTSGSAGTLAYTSRVSNTSPASSAQQAGGMRPPPPDDGGGFIGAIADALKSIGVDGGNDASATDGTSTDGDTGNTAQALGGFLENLMSALHAQNTGGTGAPPAYGEAPQGGPGRLSADLQSLISALGDGTQAANVTDSIGTGDATSSMAALQGSFKDLLTSLGGDSGDADAKLSGFLQALAAKLPTAGSAGNLIDTTA